MAKLILFQGNNTTNILEEARGYGLCEGRTPLVITMENERLTPPKGVETITVTKFSPEVGEDYRVIGNGGGTAQAPATYSLVAAHARGEIKLEVINLQREEGPITIWPKS